MNKNIKLPVTGDLTEKMDTDSMEFDNFQAILLNRSRERSEKHMQNIELLAIKYQIEEYLQKEVGEIKLAGAFLKQYLQVLKIKQSKFAEYIGIKPSNLSKLISGERSINYNLALIFGRIFDVNPMYWIEIQAKNELIQLKKTEGKKYNNYSINDLV